MYHAYAMCIMSLGFTVGYTSACSTVKVVKDIAGVRVKETLNPILQFRDKDHAHYVTFVYSLCIQYYYYKL